MARGRKTGSKNIPSATIKDDLLVPYWIRLEDNSYIVYKEGTIHPRGYFTSLPYALKHIIQAKLSESTYKESYTVQSYIESFKNEIHKLTNILQTWQDLTEAS
jgi:hypothetical protein